MSIQRDKTGGDKIESSQKEWRPGFPLPRPSGGLREVLLRASMIGEHTGDGVNLSFTSILLGFLASQTPLARWFQGYVAKAGVNVDAMLSRIHADRRLLEEAARGSVKNLSVADTRPTASAENIIRGAVSLRDQVIRTQPSNELHQRHVMAAYIYHCPPNHEAQLDSWKFDRAHWSSSFLSFIYSMPELRERELKQWMEVHTKKFGAAPEFEKPSQPPAEPTAPAVPPDVTLLHLDNPADADYLGRRGFAEALAARLNRVWDECNPEGRKTEARSSFVLHLHGPWGSGKTSLLNFLKRELQPARGEKAAAPGSRGWVVVEFNAWQHQRISPPWWPLLESVSKQAAGQLRADFGEGGHARWLRVREWWWRFSTGRKVYLVTAVIAFVLATLLYVLKNANVFPEGLTAVFGPANSFVAYASVVVGVWSSVLVVSRSLLSGSARAAQSFMETAGDPMERVCAHFRELLEGVQTLFSDPRVVYVVAADRRWLNTCFETTYQAFADAVKEPGRRLGSLFLEKAFELSVSVPRLSDEMRQVYWDFLVGGTRRDIERAIRERSAEAEREFTGAMTEEQVLKVLGTVSPVAAGIAGEERDALREQVRRGAAVRQLASSEVVASTEYFLKPFAPLLEPNPRAMKRLVNAYSVLRDMALLAGVDVLGDIDRRKQLALWAIVSLRWPLLEEYLEGNPGAIDSIREGRTRDGQSPLIPDEGLQKLAESEEVSNVFKGGGTGTGLEGKVVSQIIGISAAQPTAATVA
ncbi:MAG TPA: P-loop NTPase fold protein [Pyrinomonadaceae bacterium]|nr:P-loop NTPase fold protein [Pyrinomonadaceae bacterium]